jgi:hypothetical protein
MLLEEALVALLDPIFPGDRVWFDLPPDAFARTDVFAVLQSMGGQVTQYVEKDTVPSHENMRLQIEIYHADRLVVAQKQREVDTAMRTVEWDSVEPFGEWVHDYNTTLKIAISRKQFGIWRAIDP